MPLRTKAIIAIISGVILSAPYHVNSENNDITFTPKGYGALEVGQIGHGHYKEGDQTFNQSISHVWQQRAFANIGYIVKYLSFLELDIVGEGMLAFSTPQVGNEPTTMQPRHFFYIKSSNAKIYLGKPSFLAVEIQAGYFPYKYNSDVRNLGEYMFRSNPYPMVLYTDFDYPMVNLLGLRLNFQGFNRFFSNDLLLHSDLVSLPVQNWSISDILETNLFNILVVGAGGSFHHYLNVYQGKYWPVGHEKYYYPENLPGNIRKMYSDTVLDNHKALKAMGRVSLNTQQLLSLIFTNGAPLPLFNKNDLRIYGEMDLIGYHNYPRYYSDRADRWIYTFGFNFPGLFIFDLINFEFEYCRNKSEFSDERLYVRDRPWWEPPDASVDENQDTIVRAPWRWSIYLKKSLFNDHLSLIAQFARDHKKLNFYYFAHQYMSFKETLPTKEDWWWTFKTEFKF